MDENTTSEVNPEHTMKRFMFYFHILKEQFNLDTYGQGFRDDVAVRSHKFYIWFYDTYGLNISKIVERDEAGKEIKSFFKSQSESITFKDYASEEKYFAEAQQAELIHLLKTK